MKDMISKVKTPKERTNLDLFELCCELHSRALMYPHSKEIHDACVEVKEEMENRIKQLEAKDKEIYQLNQTISFQNKQLDNRDKEIEEQKQIILTDVVKWICDNRMYTHSALYTNPDTRETFMQNGLIKRFLEERK